MRATLPCRVWEAQDSWTRPVRLLTFRSSPCRRFGDMLQFSHKP